MMTFPGHRLGKFYDSLNGVQQGTVPMVLQNPQTTLYRVILAVIGRIIGQAYLDAIVHHKIDDALDELRAPTMILWSVIQVDHQQLNMGKTITCRFPPLDQPIHQAITGDFPADHIQKQFITFGKEDPHGCHRCRGLKIVISSFHVPPTPSSSRERANFDRRFGIHRDSQDVFCGIRSLIDPAHSREDGIGGWNFFWGLTLATFFKTYPRALSLFLMVCSHGSSSSV